MIAASFQIHCFSRNSSRLPASVSSLSSKLSSCSSLSDTSSSLFDSLSKSKFCRYWETVSVSSRETMTSSKCENLVQLQLTLPNTSLGIIFTEATCWLFLWTHCISCCCHATCMIKVPHNGNLGLFAILRLFRGNLDVRRKS